MTFWKQPNYSKGEQTSGCQGLGLEEGCDYKGAAGEGPVLILIVVELNTNLYVLKLIETVHRAILLYI